MFVVSVKLTNCCIISVYDLDLHAKLLVTSYTQHQAVRSYALFKLWFSYEAFVYRTTSYILSVIGHAATCHYKYVLRLITVTVC